MNRLIFTRSDVTIFEDCDFPEDPAPYASIDARDFPVILELEEGECLGRALTQWVREHEERAARKVRDARRRARELAEIHAELTSAAGPLLQTFAPPTLLEALRRSRGRSSPAKR